MSSAVQKTTKTYTYRSGAGGANSNTDVSIEYSADLSALSRLEVSYNNTHEKKDTSKDLSHLLEFSTHCIIIEIINDQ